MKKKVLFMMAVMLLAVFGFSACTSINREMVDYGSLSELQTALPDLYYFDFDSSLETNDPEASLVFESTIEPVSFSSMAIVYTKFPSNNNVQYEHFGYQINYNLRVNTKLVQISVTGYKHNSRDFIVTDSRISNEYQSAVQKNDYIKEVTIDGIRCVIYGNTTAFFWTDAQQYMITIHQAINNDTFTLNNFTSFIELAVTNRYRS